MLKYISLTVLILTILSCKDENHQSQEKISPKKRSELILSLSQANRLAKLPLECIQNPLPYKSGIIISKSSDLKMPIEHHPAFYGCFDWHSAVHGHWSLVYLLKTFPDLNMNKEIRRKLSENITSENIIKEIEYFSLNRYTKSFERTYGWAWLLKLQEELYGWDDTLGRKLYNNIKPLAEHISQEYINYLPKLVYPIRVGEHSNTAFGLSFAYDYAIKVNDNKLKSAIEASALRFYSQDADCPIHYEPSGYDFLSPCLQELDIMRKILSDEDFAKWSRLFLPSIFKQELKLEPGKIKDRSDGKLVHLDGLNFSRAWCLYGIKDNQRTVTLADEHLLYSLENITDGDYAGQHWLASFALYALDSKSKNK